MDNVFDSMQALNTEEVAAAAADAGEKKAEKQALKKAKKAEMIAAFRASMQDPQFRAVLSTASNSLKVVNSLGFGENGNIFINKDTLASEGREHSIAQTSVIVGYKVQNVGDAPIEYQTEEWTRGENGQYVANKVTKVLAPGAVADLSRAFMTLLCMRPEFSFKLANGHIMRGSGANAVKDPRKELESYYFAFDKGSDLEINSDEVKLQVGVKGADGKWSVKPEYAATFGYLENEKTRATREKKEGTKFSSYEIAANYVRQLMEKSDM